MNTPATAAAENTRISFALLPQFSHLLLSLYSNYILYSVALLSGPGIVYVFITSVIIIHSLIINQDSLTF